GVVKVADIGGADPPDQIGGLRGGVEDVALEAVERLDGDLDSGSGGVSAGLPEHLGCTLDFLRLRAATTELTEGLVERAHEYRAPECFGTIGEPAQVIDSAGALRGVG